MKRRVMRHFERDVQDVVLACLAGETVTWIAPHHSYAQEVYEEAQRRLARLRHIDGHVS
jgi:hypothetical protein